MTGVPEATNTSPIDAAARAIAQVRNHLFPFRLERWLALGLVAFLDQCGRVGGGGGGGNGNWSSPSDDAGETIEQGANWISEHVVLVVVLVAVALILMIAITALVLWLNSRGTFMYIDNVATGRADVVRPWCEHRRHANSYFAWKFGLALATMGAVIVTIIPLLIAIVSLARHGPRPWPVVIVILATLTLLLISLAVALFSVVLRDFVAPIQLQSGASCGGALRLFTPLLRAHLVSFILYLLLKIVYVLVFGMTFVALVCVTCLVALCCLVLPIISQTILQPLFYFERAWSLQLLAGMGYDVAQALPSSDVGAPIPAR